MLYVPIPAPPPMPMKKANETKFPLTPRAHLAFYRAKEEVVRRDPSGRALIEPLDLLVGLMQVGNGLSQWVLCNKLGLSVEPVRAWVQDHRRPESSLRKAIAGFGVSAILDNAHDAACVVAQRNNEEYLGTEHLLLGLIEDTKSQVVALLAHFALTPDVIRNELAHLMGHPVNAEVNPAEPTYRQQLQTLPEPYRSQLLQGSCGIDVAADPPPSLSAQLAQRGDLMALPSGLHTAFLTDAGLLQRVKTLAQAQVDDADDEIDTPLVIEPAKPQ